MKRSNGSNFNGQSYSIYSLTDVDNRLAMFFAMSVGNMVQAKQIHHKLRDLMYEGLGVK